MLSMALNPIEKGPLFMWKATQKKCSPCFALVTKSGEHFFWAAFYMKSWPFFIQLNAKEQIKTVFILVLRIRWLEPTPINPTETGGGVKVTCGCISPYITAGRRKKSEFGAWKMPSPIPTTPPTPRAFIVYTVSTSTTLVESTNCVLSSHLFIHTCTSEKTSKKVQSQ